MQNFKKFTLLALGFMMALCTSFMFVGCGNDNKIRLNEVTHSIFYAPLYVALNMGFFEDEGILVYHVNATLKKETYGGEIYYSLKNNNTDPSDAYGTEDNLIELIKSADGGYVFDEYDSLAANQKMDDGKNVSYVFTVNNIAEDGATVTFRKNA